MSLQKVNGDRYDMPSDLRECLSEEELNQVVYWSKPDPTQPIFCGLWCGSLGPLLFLPCFWPHLAILCLPSICVCSCNKRAMLLTAVVVTTRSIEYITVPHEVCCVPGCYRKNVVKKSVNGSQCVNVMIDVKDSGLLTSCMPDLSKLTVMDGTMAGKRGNIHVGTSIVGHKDLDILKDHIMRVQGFQGEGRQGASAPAPMTRGGNGPRTVYPMSSGTSDGIQNDVASRLNAAQNLLNSGLITQEEYNVKRAEILKSF